MLYIASFFSTNLILLKMIVKQVIFEEGSFVDNTGDTVYYNR